jgi:hypothetical protein
MAHFDERIEDSNGNIVQIRVPSLQGGTDRTIYVNENATKYCLGKNNDKIYNQRSGSEVSELPLKKFVKTFIDKDDNSIYP